MTISSAKRDRCTAARLAAASASTAKSRSETASSELAAGRSKPSASAVICAVDGEGGAGERGGAERRFVQPLAGVGEAAAVAAEHLDIGHQMMAEGHRLGRLQVGEAGHDGGGVGERLLGQRLLQGGERRVGAVDGVAHPQPEVGGDLVVARARRVQPAGGRADQLGQPRLDIEVDVLQRAGKGERRLLRFLAGSCLDPLQSFRHRPPR